MVSDVDLLVTNIGTLFTGDLAQPRLDADSLLCREGKIVQIGARGALDVDGPVAVLDVNGATVAPGLIDPHVHPVFGTFTPRHSTLGWIESYVHGGITTMISAGEPHLPGRPRTAAGSKALALLAHASYQQVHPLGATVHAGAVLLEPGLTDADFEELAAEGVWLVGEIGISGVYDAGSAGPMVEAAKKYGFHVPVHVGGASVPGSSSIGADLVVALQPDVAVHCNGGPTAPSREDVGRIIADSGAAIEVVQAGNIRALVDVVGQLRDAKCLQRLQIATDTPSGTGVVPSGILRTMAYCCALADLEVETVIAAATGLTAARFGLDCGIVAVDRPADLVVLSAPRGSVARSAADALRIGDMPAVAAVVTAGVVRLTASKVTPAATQAASIRDAR